MEHVETLRRIIRFTKDRDTLITDLGMGRFHLLVSAILSSRTREEATLRAAKKLASKVKKPGDMLEIGESEIEKMIKGVAFHRNKAKILIRLSRILIEEHGGEVPGDVHELIKLPGIGRKTANLVIAEGFGKPAICVDTHVHRISNRLGWVSTRKPEETEKELMKLFPKKYWKSINRALVVFGRSVCRPVRPLCMECPVKEHCKYGRVV